MKLIGFGRLRRAIGTATLLGSAACSVWATPEIIMNPNSYDFGTVSVSSGPTTTTITVQNWGDTPLSFTGSGITLSGTNASEFALGPLDLSSVPALTQPPPLFLPTPGSRPFALGFDPNSTNNKVAQINVTTNDPAHPTVTVALGGSGGADADSDGIIDTEEASGPNSGDGNFDGIQDSAQSNVTTFQSVAGPFLTLAGPAGITFKNIATYNDPMGFGAPFILPHSTACNSGYLKYDIYGVTPAGSVTVQLYRMASQPANSYYIYGSLPGPTAPAWFKFDYNGTTGATVSGNIITLHFVDGQRGDLDLTANGIIQDPAAPAQEATSIRDWDVY